MIDTRVVKNILIETLVNSDADVSFILSYTNLVKTIIINKWYYVYQLTLKNIRLSNASHVIL
ncbi:hypothetical protein [Holdemanella biformis]|jgi:uncharacterized protein YaiL (DUF2058 family)|uniref:Uncharacterized protein n=1 Tax=Holdemanella biformis DSM 3989 TaxID=518637 RepID=B7C8K1_9FIRM|nr:hypothetical protein [Holdemanella biformis]EEC90904.1 hypothetical protein EUBIFOR_00505 [Holdemanella biformis DSM 3989]